MVDSHPMPEPLPPGHPTAACALTGGMGLALAAGLHVSGWLEVIDRNLNGAFANGEALAPLPSLSPAAIWLATSAFAFGIAWVLLQMPGNWRRITIWISAQVIMLGWIPVAAIAKSSIPAGGPWIACTWSGLCAIIYATRHRMPADAPPPPELTPDNDQHPSTWR